MFEKSKIQYYVCNDNSGMKCLKSDKPPVFNKEDKEFYQDENCSMYEWNDVSVLDFMNIKYDDVIKVGEFKKVK